MEVLKDRDIRQTLINSLTEFYENDPHTIILQEFGLFEHRVRIDLAVINSSMSGFEIKSDADTLGRLPYQEEIYSRIFDKVVIVVGESQLNKIKAIVPEWWGIWVAWDASTKVGIRVAREPKDNQNIDPKALVRCLWKQDALEILKMKHLYDKKLDKARRSVIWDILVDSVSLQELKSLVCNCLKQRDGWHIVLPRGSNGDSHLLRPIL